MTVPIFGANTSPVSGLPTQSLDMESSNTQYMSMSNSDFGSYDVSQFSISTWIYAESLTSQIVAMFKNSEFLLTIGIDGSINFSIGAGGTDFGRLITNASEITTGSFFYITANFDFSESSTNRLRLYKNGTEITSFSSEEVPTTQFSTTGNEARVGFGNSAAPWDGLLYQHSFFSGANANPTTIYNSGTPIDIKDETGLYSMLNVAGGDVTNDLLLTAAWTNNNGVTASGTTP